MNHTRWTTMKRSLAWGVFWMMGSAWGAACAGTQEASPPPVEPASVSAAEEVSRAMDALLDHIEAAAAGVKSLRAKVRVETVQGLVGDEQRRFGTLWYQAGPPGKFALHLDRVLVDSGGGKFRTDPLDRWYVFDGVWLLERNVDEKVAIRRQVVAPGQDPAAVDPLGSGEGPFVLPLRAKKADLLKRFIIPQPAVNGQATTTATTTAMTKDEDLTVTLLLLPRPGTQASEDLEKIVLTYDAATLLPTKAQSVEKSGDQTTIVLMESQVNDEALIETDVFDTSVPTEAGWQVDVRPWSEK
jgi:hypothetical protein